MRDVTKIIPAATVEAVDRRWLAQAQAARPVPRQLEQSERNEGLAQWMTGASRNWGITRRAPVAEHLRGSVRQCCRPPGSNARL
jgi:hypothetical protein